MKNISVVFFFLFFLSVSQAKCPEGKHLVRKHKRITKAGKKTTVSSYCRKNPPGYSHWNSLLKNHTKYSILKKNYEFLPWSPHEAYFLTKIINTIPEFLAHEPINGILKAKRPQNEISEAIFQERYIIIFQDSINKKDPPLKEVLIHELSHSHYKNLSLTLKDSYLKKLGWSSLDLKGKEVWAGREDGYVFPDGVIDPDEDFSNNLQVYLINPMKLKRITPKAHDWIRNYLKSLGDKK